jgi:nicotinamide mononucleotide (NMN) deamidase PncC
MQEKIKELSERIMRLARERRTTVATVESCTAGLLAHILSQLKARRTRCMAGSPSIQKKTRPRR